MQEGDVPNQQRRRAPEAKGEACRCADDAVDPAGAPVGCDWSSQSLKRIINRLQKYNVCSSLQLELPGPEAYHRQNLKAQRLLFAVIGAPKA